MAVGVVAALVMLARRVAGAEPEVVAREVIEPGHRLTVKVLPRR